MVQVELVEGIAQSQTERFLAVGVQVTGFTEEQLQRSHACVPTDPRDAQEADQALPGFQAYRKKERIIRLTGFFQRFFVNFL